MGNESKNYQDHFVIINTIPPTAPSVVCTTTHVDANTITGVTPNHSEVKFRMSDGALIAGHGFSSHGWTVSPSDLAKFKASREQPRDRYDNKHRAGIFPFIPLDFRRSVVDAATIADAFGLPSFRSPSDRLRNQIVGDVIHMDTFTIDPGMSCADIVAQLKKFMQTLDDKNAPGASKVERPTAPAAGKEAASVAPIYCTEADLDALRVAGMLKNVAIEKRRDARFLASRIADTYLGMRGPLPPVEWGPTIYHIVATIAAYRLLIEHGYNPADPANAGFVGTYNEAMEMLRDFAAKKINLGVRFKEAPITETVRIKVDDSDVKKAEALIARMTEATIKLNAAVKAADASRAAALVSVDEAAASVVFAHHFLDLVETSTSTTNDPAGDIKDHEARATAIVEALRRNKALGAAAEIIATLTVGDETD